MKRIKVLAFILVCVSLHGCYQGVELTPDHAVWEYAKPSDLGLDDEQFIATNDLIKDGVYEFIDGLIILKDDKIIFENYYDFSTRQQVRSIGRNTYTVLISLLGSFIEDGKILSLDDPIANYLPDYADVFSSTPEKSKITIRHMLENKSGLVWNESVIATSSDRSDIVRMQSSIDWVRYVLEKPQEAEPGLRLVFNSGHGIILSKIMGNVLSGQTLENYFKEKLFSPIGISKYDWKKDPNGTLDGSNGLMLTSFDWLKFGKLIMNKGRWINKKRVISEDWYFEISSRPELQSQYFSYGYGWWEFTPELFVTYNIPEQEMLVMTGDLGENMYILPEQNLVIVIHGENCCYGFFNPSFSLFTRLIGLFNSASIQ